MSHKYINILLIEDNPGDARLIQEMLKETKDLIFKVECVDRLSAALVWLAEQSSVVEGADQGKETVTLVLLDLSLPDSQGLDALINVQAQAPDVPIIVLTGLEDGQVSAQALQMGAQDYLAKNSLDINLLNYAVRHATERKQTQVKLKQQAAHMSLINEIGRQIASVLDLRSVLERTARLVHRSFNYHHVALFLLEGELLRLNAVAGSYEAYFPLGHIQQISEGINGWVATHGEKIVANNVELEPRYTSLIAEYSVTQAEICLPIKIADEIVGVLDIQSPQQNSFSDSEVMAMETLTDQIAIAIKNARLYQLAQQEIEERRQAQNETQQRNRELLALQYTGATIASSLDLTYVLDTVTKEMIKLLDTEVCIIWEWQEMTESSVVIAQQYRNIPNQQSAEPIAPNQDRLIKKILTGRRALQITKDEAEPDSDWLAYLVNTNAQAILFLPMEFQERLVGVFEIRDPRNKLVFSNEVVRLAQLLANQAAAAIQNASLYSQQQQEIAERKRAEEALQASDERYRQIIENSPIPIFSVDQTGSIVSWNQACTLVFRRGQEIIGQNFKQILHDSNEHRVVSYMIAQIFKEQTQTLPSIELAYLAEPNHYRFMVSRLFPIFDDGGQVEACVFINADITKRKRTEEALRQSEQHFRQVVTSISDHIYMAEVRDDTSPAYHYHSPNIAKLTGYPAENFKQDWNLWSSELIHPEDRERALAHIERLRNGEPGETEYRIVQLAGEIIWVRDRARVERSHSALFVYGIISDVTEQKRVQEEVVRLYVAERKRNQEAEALRKAALALTSTISLELVIEQILVQLQNVVPYDSASIQLLEEGELTIIGGRGFSNLSNLVGAKFSTETNITPNAKVLASRKPVIFNDVQKEFSSFYKSPHGSDTRVRSWLGVPMSIGTKTIGMLTIDKQEPNFYSEVQSRLAMAYAAQAAIAIENARLYAETEQRAEHLSVMHDLDRAISAGRHLGEVYQAFAEHSQRLFPYDRIAILFGEADTLRVAFVAGGAKGPRAGQKVAVGSVWRWVIKHEKPLLIPDLNVWNHKYSDKPPSDIQSLMTIPLKIKQRIIGTVNFGSSQPNTYIDNELIVAQFITDQLALGIENARLNEKAQQEISERRQAQEALELERVSLAQRVAERTLELSQANAELARAARLKDEFLASMSHELRTPLSAILGMSETLQEQVLGPMNEDQMECAYDIEESGRHLLALINDILDLSKIEAGKTELILDRVVVEDLCQASLRMVKQTAHKKSLKLISTLDNMVMDLEADERRLKQILVNLLSNAVKFTPDGGQVGLEVMGDSTQQTITFTVWDTGIGIAEEDTGRLFQPFVQLDSRLSRQYAGTGLGLALVYRLTKLHGGSVSLESKVGQGSRFIISLPWRRALLDSLDDEGEYVLGELVGDQAAETDLVENNEAELPKVLVAEDNLSLIKTVAKYLSTKGYNVIEALNGVEALAQARAYQPNIILMDIQMPDMDGLEAIHHLRMTDETAQVPIIAVTALAMSGDREKCMAAGANAYLSKPVSLTELVKTIESLL